MKITVCIGSSCHIKGSHQVVEALQECVSINHLDGFSSIYMHMTHYVVSKGQNVSQGQLIGYVGNTGISTGDHLHFGISYAGTYVNPLAYIY